MTPIEKAENALNRRISQLQAHLRESTSETTQRFLLQSLVVSIGIGEALTDYVKKIGEYAQSRHRELKPAHDTLTAEHAEVLKSAQALLEQFKANPTDQALRKKIEAAQRNMAAIQKSLRRGANALQREVAPSIGMIDPLALSVRRLAEAEESDTLKRVINQFAEHVHELYRVQPSLPAKDIIDPADWGKSAGAEIDQATDSHEAYARTGHQAMLAIDMMTLAVSPTPPRTNAEAIERASESVAARVKAITARLSAS